MISIICAVLPAIFKRNVEIFGFIALIEVCFVDWWLLPMFINKLM